MVTSHPRYHGKLPYRDCFRSATCSLHASLGYRSRCQIRSITAHFHLRSEHARSILRIRLVQGSYPLRDCSSRCDNSLSSDVLYSHRLHSTYANTVPIHHPEERNESLASSKALFGNDPGRWRADDDVDPKVEASPVYNLACSHIALDKPG